MLLQWDARGRHPIWMADMRFPLDLILLEQDGRVAGVLTNVPICSVAKCPTYEPEGTQESVAAGTRGRKRGEAWNRAWNHDSALTDFAELAMTLLA
jgi:uncharacterized membrane protein (UPF0127 family)